MILGIDVDGVLANFNLAFAAIVKQHTGIELNLPPQTWNHHLDAGVSPEQNGSIWAAIWADPTFWVSLDPLPSAKETLQGLKALGAEHQVYFITSRPSRTAKAQIEIWLMEHGYPLPTVLVAQQKGLIAAGLGLDIILDDLPDNLFDAKAARPECQTIMVRAPYNRWATQDPRIDAQVDMAESVLGYIDE